MNTEITDNKGGWVLYDGDCSLCTGWASRFGRVLRRAGFTLATLQSGAGRLDVCPASEPTEMLVLTPDGRTFGGADGLVQIARRVWWAWPLFALAQIPGVLSLLRAVYRWLAANRHCLGDTCRAPGQKPPTRRTRRSHRTTAFFEMP